MAAWLRTRRRKIFFATALAIIVSTGLFLIARHRNKPTIIYYRDRDGVPVADIRGNAGFTRIPFVLLKGASIRVETYALVSNHWSEQPFALKSRWGQIGSRILVAVPETDWRAELRVAPQRLISIGGYLFPLPVRTNIILSAQGPGRTNIPEFAAPVAESSIDN